ncbi:hypothetical protein [Mycobacterium sp. D16R24]|uniref:hypothetical protein n=1 Tax=Mycobacterium sp. D16R24 TaxID=1855656 RepID=UPI0015923292|nr:hypothetical protein [Mycobacterium sp. D16R24]
MNLFPRGASTREDARLGVGIPDRLHVGRQPFGEIAAGRLAGIDGQIKQSGAL